MVVNVGGDLELPKNKKICYGDRKLREMHFF
jgi:hypothetical protein